MGDNRDSSYDGRYWGFLPRENVRGRPLVVYFSYDPSSWRALPFLTAVRWGRLFSSPE
jgi:signal peptidase I